MCWLVIDVILCFPFVGRLFVLLMTFWGRAGSFPAPRAPTPIASSLGASASTLALPIAILLLNYGKWIWLVLNFGVVMMIVVLLLDWLSRNILDSVIVIWRGWCIAWLVIAPVNLHRAIFIVS